MESAVYDGLGQVRTLPRKFKPDFEVLTRFAEVFQKSYALRKTHLHLASRLNWSLFTRYLRWLEANNFVRREVDGKSERYRSTQTGTEMFKTIMKLREYISPAEPTWLN